MGTACYRFASKAVEFRSLICSHGRAQTDLPKLKLTGLLNVIFPTYRDPPLSVRHTP